MGMTAGAKRRIFWTGLFFVLGLWCFSPPYAWTSGFMLDERGEPAPVIVLTDGAKVYPSPGATSPIASKPFLSQYFLVNKRKVGEKEYFLAGLMNPLNGQVESEIGWFDGDDVLTQAQAKKKTQGIFLKGIVVTRWDTGSDGRAKLNITQIRKGPGENFGKTGEALLYQFYYIYKTAFIEGKQYYFLGEAPYIPIINRPGQVLMGWVPADRLVEWSTRQAVEFDKTNLAKRKARGAKALIFNDQKEVYAWMAQRLGRSVPAKFRVADENPIGVEDMEVTSWKYMWPRYPLFHAAKNDLAPELGPLLNIGYIGDQIFISGDKGRHWGDISEQRNKFQGVLKDLKNIEILFVIDSTGSMHKFFDTAAQAVNNIASFIKDNYRRDEKSMPEVRFAVTFYRDYCDEDGDSKVPDTYLVKRRSLTGNTAAVAQYLHDEKRSLCDGCGGDDLEAVYYAIESAVLAAKSEVSDTSVKAVVLIGDCGNHQNDARGYTAEKIAELLNKEGYEFVYLHVVSEDEAQKKPYYGLFREQGDKIIRLTAGSRIISQTYHASDNPEDMARYLVEYAMAMTDAAAKMKSAGTDLARGEGLISVGKKYGLQITKRLTEMMRKRGIDPESFVEKSAQPFGRGWMAERDPVTGLPLARMVILMDRNMMEQLIGVLATVTKNPPSRRDVVSTWTKALKDLNVGEGDIAKKKVADLISARLGIPVRKKILKKTLNQIKNLTPMQLAELRLDLLMDLHRARAILAEKMVKVSKVRDAAGNWKIKVEDLGDRSVWWDPISKTINGFGTSFGWIPMDELP